MFSIASRVRIFPGSAEAERTHKPLLSASSSTFSTEVKAAPLDQPAPTRGASLLTFSTELKDKLSSQDKIMHRSSRDKLCIAHHEAEQTGRLEQCFSCPYQADSNYASRVCLFSWSAEAERTSRLQLLVPYSMHHSSRGRADRPQHGRQSLATRLGSPSRRGPSHPNRRGAIRVDARHPSGSAREWGSLRSGRPSESHVRDGRPSRMCGPRVRVAYRIKGCVRGGGAGGAVTPVRKSFTTHTHTHTHTHTPVRKSSTIQRTCGTKPPSVPERTKQLSLFLGPHINRRGVPQSITAG